MSNRFAISFYAIFASLLILASIGLYGTETGKAINAAMGQAVLDQGTIISGVKLNSSVAFRG
jgi:hypothetical protein